MDYSKLIDDLQAFIERGESEKARKALLGVNVKSVSRQYRVRLANLSWRCGIPFLGLRLLAPVVVSEQAQVADDTTDPELLEYSVLLQKIGSITEAEERLQQVDSNRYPKALLYAAFCNFSRWNYKKSTTLLEKYYGHTQLNNKDRAIAGINLYSSYIGGESFERASTLSSSLEKFLQENSYLQLLGNYHELSAQIGIFNADSKWAENHIAKATEYLKSDSSFGSLFLKKWQAFLESQKRGDEGPLLTVRKEGLLARHSEVVRDIDMLRLKINFDQTLFDQLIYGTPYQTFHKRALNFLGVNSELESRKILGESDQPVFDLFGGEKNGVEIFKPGKDLHRALYALSSDSYRPLSLGGFHEKVFQGEYFDVYSSPNKIHQLLYRSRQALQKNHLQLEIKEWAGLYFFKNKGESLCFDLEKQIPTMDSVSIRKISHLFGAISFSRDEVCKKLGVSKSSGRRILLQGLENGHLVKENKGKATLYRLSDTLKKTVKSAS